MSKGPKISPTLKRLVVQEALRDRNRPRMVLVAELRNLIELMGEQMPAEETLAKLISWARNHAPRPEDAPWTVGASREHGISHDTMPAVLHVWKLCLMMGEPFTIREAKWVAQLQTVVTNIVNLKRWSQSYAIRERACEALGEPLQTSDLDERLAMGVQEFAVAGYLGKLKSSTRRREPFRQCGEPVQWENSTADEVVRIAEGTEGAKLPPVSRSGLSEEGKWLYAHWLLHLRNGPKWVDLVTEHQLSIIQELRQFVLARTYTKGKVEISGVGTSPRPAAIVHNGDEPPEGFAIVIPSGLLREVGYDV